MLIEPLLFALVVDRFTFFRVVITIHWVLDDRTATMSDNANDLLLLVVACCLSASCLALLHCMVRGGDLWCQHLLRHWLMLHGLHLKIIWRHCEVAQLGELAWTENRLRLYLLLLLLRLDATVLLLKIGWGCHLLSVSYHLLVSHNILHD